MTAAIYLAAAFAEIAGCFLIWRWLRLDGPAWLALPALAALAAFAALLTLAPAAFAGRAYAAYGGVYPTALLLAHHLAARSGSDGADDSLKRVQEKWSLLSARNARKTKKLEQAR